MRRRSTRAAAFTLIEVMIAVAVMTVGALGVMALQQAATRGNMQARQMTTGTQVAQTWIERLRRDAVRWNAAGPPDQTTWLVAAPPAANAPGQWTTPAAQVDANGNLESYAFDYFGNDTNNPAQMVYCAQYRLRWLVQGSTLKAEVRAFWAHRNPQQRFDDCGNGNEAGVTAALTTLTDLHAVYASTLIRRIPLNPNP